MDVGFAVLVIIFIAVFGIAYGYLATLPFNFRLKDNGIRTEENKMTWEMKLREEREDAAIEATIETALEFNASNEVIVQKLMSKFQLSETEAKERLDEYFELTHKTFPVDAKTKDVVHILQSMHVRPGMYFGETRSYNVLRAFLLGFGAGVRAQGEESCCWANDLGHKVDDEFLMITEGKEYSDEEKFDVFFEVFDHVLNRDYPQYI